VFWLADLEIIGLVFCLANLELLELVTEVQI